MFKRISILLASVLPATISPAFAADELSPQAFEERFSGSAVSGLNAKIEYGYFHTGFDDAGNDEVILESASGHQVLGAVSVPLGTAFGLQIDAGVIEGSAETNDFFPVDDFDIEGHGFGGHLFWRDPSRGLLGVYAHRVDYELEGLGVDITRWGVEGEAYLGSLTLKGFLGQDQVEFETFGDETYDAFSAEALYYLTDDVAVSAGYEKSFETDMFNVGIEAAFSASAIAPSAFATASISNGETSVMAGLKVYLGQSAKSLKRRHREDDPDIGMFNNLAALGNCINDITGINERRFLPASLAELRPVIRPTFDIDGCDLDMEQEQRLPGRD